MKTFVSLRTQRTILFIPFVNVAILFIWIYNYGRTQTEFKVLAKSLLIVLLAAAPIAVLQILVSRTLAQFELVQTVMNLVAMYFLPVSVGYSLIQYQKKLFGDR